MTRPTHIIGSLIFCPECGNLLDTPSGDTDLIVCNACGYAVSSADIESVKVVTTSSESAFPSPLKAKRSLVQQKDPSSLDQQEDGATIKEKCPQCGNDTLNFHTMQLRSADEGQTVFLNCRRCGYKDKLNT
ncbi:hypothetical protein BZG36_02834 [Bifiguratus adelaidae]|uniref:DNA-directed RNA polymerase subunit n=1 Tax=Bifiguratus adelaidae TaxID=1938954 RepID=A0A261Y0M1_9FUNG|nr:hypothetical protein BZG36_02834 [Bifiguratus adelaidae]